MKRIRAGWLTLLCTLFFGSAPSAIGGALPTQSKPIDFVVRGEIRFIFSPPVQKTDLAQTGPDLDKIALDLWPKLKGLAGFQKDVVVSMHLTPFHQNGIRGWHHTIDGQQELTIDREALGTPSLYILAAHELTHFLRRSLVPTSSGFWFEEGIAKLIEFELFGTEPRRSLDAIQVGGQFTLNRSQLTPKAETSIQYAEAFLWLFYLVNHDRSADRLHWLFRFSGKDIQDLITQYASRDSFKKIPIEKRSVNSLVADFAFALIANDRMLGFHHLFSLDPDRRSDFISSFKLIPAPTYPPLGSDVISLKLNPFGIRHLELAGDECWRITTTGAWAYRIKQDGGRVIALGPTKDFECTTTSRHESFVIVTTVTEGAVVFQRIP